MGLESAHSASAAAVWTLIAAFAASGLIQLMGPRAIRQAYRRWDYRRDTHRFVATVDLVTAVLIFLPETRPWGLVAAGLVLFGAVVTLFDHGKYPYALPALLLMAALAPAAESVL